MFVLMKCQAGLDGSYVASMQLGIMLKTVLLVMQLLSMMAQSSEFGQMAIREEELPELDALARDACHFDIKGGPENKHGKVNILLQVCMLLCIRQQ